MPKVAAGFADKIIKLVRNTLKIWSEPPADGRFHSTEQLVVFQDIIWLNTHRPALRQPKWSKRSRHNLRVRLFTCSVAETTDDTSDCVHVGGGEAFGPHGKGANMLLVVENELHLLDLLEDEFSYAGFEVVTACNGKHAIAELDVNSARFLAVRTDINLGAGPDGWEISRHVRVLVPDMAIVYMTDASAHDWPSHGVPGSVLVTKPFMLDHIIKTVSALLTETDACRALTK